MNKVKLLYLCLIGLAYLFYGLLGLVNGVYELYSGHPILNSLQSVPSDPFEGFTLLVIGTILLSAGISLRRDEASSLSFLTVGLLMVGMLFTLHVLIIAAKVGMLILLGEGYDGWTSLQNVGISLMMFLFTSPLYLFYRRLKVDIHAK